tara:strand:- start:1104 stop:1517 length:414 start_codon:yes stop_codon:yes gene_type:complete
MSRQTGSVRFHNTVYPYLEENGPLSTYEIFDWVNNRTIEYKNGPHSSLRRRTSESYTKHQVSQILRVSKWFRKVGETKSRTSHGKRSIVFVYEVVPVVDVLTKVIATKHHYQDPDKTMPKFAKEMYLKMKEDYCEQP